MPKMQIQDVAEDTQLKHNDNHINRSEKLDQLKALCSSIMQGLIQTHTAVAGCQKQRRYRRPDTIHLNGFQSRPA